VADNPKQEGPRRPLADRRHRQRPLRYWVVPLLIILLIIIFLPRLLALLD